MLLVPPRLAHLIIFFFAAFLIIEAGIIIWRVRQIKKTEGLVQVVDFKTRQEIEDETARAAKRCCCPTERYFLVSGGPDRCKWVGLRP